MTDTTMSYSPSAPYLSHQPQYYSSPNVNDSAPVAQQGTRTDLAQRKRPKYTRSKTGCMTCRVKKIKCDESKPVCMRCTHGSRECSWPEGVPTRKKSNARKDSIDDHDRPSTAGSSGLSESSTPPTREQSPPRRNQVDLNLMPLSSRSSDAFASLHSLNADHDSGRRPLERSSSYPQHPPHLMSLMPENHYPSRYDPTYLNGQVARGMPAPYRPLAHQSTGHWGPADSLDPYYHGHHGLQERALVGHSSPNDHSHNRYQ